MQIFALKDDGSLIFARQAAKHTDYKCLECKETVRLRSGSQRQAHFYHSHPNGACRLHSKGMPHLMLQYHLIDLLPEGEAELECRFESIGRVADVAWHPQRLIFEIQCSPIGPEEILARNASYATLGYQVVWILHDARYNRYRLSAAEQALADHTHYFSDMDASGIGKIYDQLAVVERGRRKLRFDSIPVDPARPKMYPDALKMKRLFNPLPDPLRSRATNWPVALSGDFLFKYGESLENRNDADNLIAQFEVLRKIYGCSLTDRGLNFAKWAFEKCFALPYRSVLKLILERACR